MKWSWEVEMAGDDGAFRSGWSWEMEMASDYGVVRLWMELGGGDKEIDKAPFYRCSEAG